MITPKKKKKFLPRRRFRSADDLIGEPTWDPSEPIAPGDVRIMRALNYYNYIDLKDRDSTLRRWVRTWAEEHSPDDVETIESLEPWRIATLAALCRMTQRGARFTEPRQAELLRRAASDHDRKMSRMVKREPRRTSVARDRSMDLIADVEDAIDDHRSGGPSPDVYSFLRTRNATQAQAQAIIDYYQPQVDELSLVRKDAQVREAYSGLGRAGINKLMELMVSIVSGAERFIGNKRVSTQRTPRRRREKAASQRVSRLQYLREHPPLQLMSVDPALIIGSGSVWTYNTRYKTLRVLTSAGQDGLDVSGSTIKNFDAAGSVQKTLRKPREGIDLVLGGTPMSLKRVMDKIATKATPANGRINDDTVILRVVR